jgi:hypothetical protein
LCRLPFISMNYKTEHKTLQDEGVWVQDTVSEFLIFAIECSKIMCEKNESDKAQGNWLVSNIRNSMLKTVFTQVRFQILTAASIRMTAFWETAPYNLVEVDRRFRGAYCLHHWPTRITCSVPPSNDHVINKVAGQSSSVRHSNGRGPVIWRQLTVHLQGMSPLFNPSH